MESENDKFYAASEEAMNAVAMALVPGVFLVDAIPIRMILNRKRVHPERSKGIYYRSKTYTRMVPWSWLQEVREVGEAEYR